MLNPTHSHYERKRQLAILRAGQVSSLLPRRQNPNRKKRGKEEEREEKGSVEDAKALKLTKQKQYIKVL